MGQTQRAVTAPIRGKRSSSTPARMVRSSLPGYQEWKASDTVRGAVEVFARAAVEASRSCPRGARPFWVADLESQVLRSLASDRPVNLQVVSTLLAVAVELGGDVDGALERCAVKLTVVLGLDGTEEQDADPLVDTILRRSLEEQDSDRAEDAVQDRILTRDFSPSTLTEWCKKAAENIAHKQGVIKLIATHLAGGR